jgi:hypothetical protein
MIMIAVRAQCPVTYATLAQSIYGVASTATKTFLTSANEPFDFLNLDMYAQDTCKATSRLTWTLGIRDTLNSNPLSPRKHVARLPGSFNTIAHDVNQPLSAATVTHLGQLFDFHPFAILQPRTGVAAGASFGARNGFGLFNDIRPGSVADIVATNPPYVRTFGGGLLGTFAGMGIAPNPANSAVDATVRADQSFGLGFS